MPLKNQIYPADAVRVNPPDPRDHRLDADYVRATAGTHKTAHIIPGWTARVRDQGGVGSCVAHAIAEIGAMFEGVEMSTDFIYGNARSDNQSGMSVNEAMSFWLHVGNVPEADMPGNTEVPDVIVKAQDSFERLKPTAAKHRIEGYAYLMGNNGPRLDVDAVMTALDLGWPINAVIKWAGQLNKTRRQDGDCICDMEGSSGPTHDVPIIGYKLIGGKPYVRVVNSHGEDWGDKGQAWCPLGDGYDWAHMWAIYDSREHIVVPGGNEEDDDMAIKTYSLSKQGNLKVSANFDVREFRCHDGSDVILIDDVLVKMLQALRDHFGRAVNISSAYRTKSYNSSIGGAANSQHLYGTAADIRVDGVTPREVARWIEANLFGHDVGGLGLYDYAASDKEGFVHVDTRTSNIAQWVQTKSTAPTGYRVVQSITADYLGEGTSTATRTLKFGLSGEDVRELQRKLAALGYALGTIDGIFGSKTKAAVIAYQASRGLDPDGIVGAKTWAALAKEAA